MALFRPYSPQQSSDKSVSEPEPVVTTPGRPAGKGAPTPTRKEAEAARRQRITPVLTKKERKVRERQIASTARNKAMGELENRPERQLLRDHVDNRWNVGEFMLPVMLLFLALSLTANMFPTLVVVATAGTWGLLLSVVLDGFLMWRSFKKILAERVPRASTRGLAMYMFNRSIMLRRFRRPAPRIARGEFR